MTRNERLTACKRVASYAFAPEATGKVPAEVMQAGLRRRVRVRLVVWYGEPLHGADLCQTRSTYQ